MLLIEVVRIATRGENWPRAGLAPSEFQVRKFSHPQG